MDIVIDKIKLPQEILEIVEKTNEPMSLDEIVEKFSPPFPFQARKVINDCAGHIFTILGPVTRKKGDEWQIPNCPTIWCEDEGGIRCYESKECTHCLKLANEATDWLPDIKSWVLI